MTSIWEKDTYFAPQDIIIAGSGFTGLWSAFYLKKSNPGLKITVIDSGWIPSGASTRNAGIACFGSLSEVVSDAAIMGTDKMLWLVEMRYKGLERIRKYFKKSEIDFEMCGGYELYNYSDKISTEQLIHNIEYINSLFKPIIGEKNTYRQTDKKIKPFGFGNTRHLVKNNFEGCLHPGKLLKALLKSVQGMGVQVLNHTEIKSYELIGDSVHVDTDHSFTFQAKQFLICTNAFTKSLVNEIDIVPARGQVLITTPIDNLPFRGTFHSEEGFYYFRNVGNRVLLGGARNKFMEEETTFTFGTSESIQHALESYLDEVVLPSFKGQYSIDGRWSGIMAMGGEKMPIMKKLEDRIYCAVRMSGMGVALAPVLAKQVTDMMTEEL